MIPVQYVRSVTARTEWLTREAFEEMTRSEMTRSAIEQCRHGNLEKAKRQLPGICWQAAAFKDNRRIDANAQSNGLFALDIDHISSQGLKDMSTPRQLWESFQQRVDELGIVCVHQTPSADGLRVVALCQPQFQTIAENQAWLADEIHCIHDAVCRDWARLYFISVEEDFYYIDWETLFG